jgi:hypothetical protein
VIVTAAAAAAAAAYRNTVLINEDGCDDVRAIAKIADKWGSVPIVFLDNACHLLVLQVV